MKTNLIIRSGVAVGLLASVLAVANCTRETPEVQAPAVFTPAPEVAPTPAPAVVKPAPKPVMLAEADDALTAKAKGLLSPGTDVDAAAKGFRSEQQFMAVAYASKNLKIPFVLLKDKVVEKKMTLARAITATSSKDVNGTLEAARAESEAKADLARKAN